MHLQTLEGLILDSHLERVSLYSRRIRVVEFTSLENVMGEATSAIILSRIQQVKPTFPLNRLSIRSLVDVPNFQISALMFLAPSFLTTMCLRGVTQLSAVVAASLIQALAANGKTLKVLELAGQLSTTLIGTLSGCTHVQSLHLEFDRNSAAPEFLWNLLLSMEALQRLYLGVHNQDVSAATLSLNATQRHPFDKLDHLEFSGPPQIVGVWIERIRVLHAPMLSSLSFNCSWSNSIDEVQPNFAACVQSSIQLAREEGKSLRELRIGATTQDAIIPFAATFGSLASCDQIQILSISASMLYIKSHDIRTLLQGGSMKNLQEFYLDDNMHAAEARLSLFVLKTFARYCKRLTTLQIPLDSGCAGGNLEAMRKEIVDNKRGSNVLHKLVIPRLPKTWDYSISNAIAFSSLLDHLFPKLQVLEGEPTKSDEKELWWGGVRDMLSTYRRISLRGVTMDVATD